MAINSRSIGIRSADHPADRPPTWQARDLPTTAPVDYVAPIERRHGAALIKRLRQRQRERPLNEFNAECGVALRVVGSRASFRQDAIYNSGQLNELSTLLLCDEVLAG